MTAGTPINAVSDTNVATAGGPPTPTTPTPAAPTSRTSNTTAETNRSYDDIPFLNLVQVQKCSFFLRENCGFRAGLGITKFQDSKSRLQLFIVEATFLVSISTLMELFQQFRSVDTFTRNLLDLGAVVAPEATEPPAGLIVNPSPPAGKRDLVPGPGQAAIATDADSLLIEFTTPSQKKTVSDARPSPLPAG